MTFAGGVCRRLMWCAAEFGWEFWTCWMWGFTGNLRQNSAAILQVKDHGGVDIGLHVGSEIHDWRLEMFLREKKTLWVMFSSWNKELWVKLKRINGNGLIEQQSIFLFLSPSHHHARWHFTALHLSRKGEVSSKSTNLYSGLQASDRDDISLYKR